MVPERKTRYMLAVESDREVDHVPGLEIPDFQPSYLDTRDISELADRVMNRPVEKRFSNNDMSEELDPCHDI